MRAACRTAAAAVAVSGSVLAGLTACGAGTGTASGTGGRADLPNVILYADLVA